MVFNLHKYMVEMAMFNVQRAIAPKVVKPELWFMWSAHHLIVIYICVKFGENVWWYLTQMMEVLMDGQTLKISDDIT